MNLIKEYMLKDIQLNKSILILATILILPCSIFADSPDLSKVAYRPAFFSGKLYPKNKKELEEIIKEYQIRDENRNSIGIKTLFVPYSSVAEAGKEYSMAYDFLRGVKYDGIILIAQATESPFDGISIYNGYGYETPFGIVKNDTALAKNIAAASQLIEYGSKGHYNANSNQEYSIEMQLPFIKYIQPQAAIVSIMIGSNKEEYIRTLTDALAKSLDKSKNYFFIIPAELSYSHNPTDTKDIDFQTLKHVEELNYVHLMEGLKEQFWESKASSALITGLMISELLNANLMLRIMYYIPELNNDDSGDDNEIVHGTFAGAFAVDPEERKPEAPLFNEYYNNSLINEVKKSITRSLANDSTPPPYLFPKKFGDYLPVGIDIKLNNKTVISKYEIKSIDPIFLSLNFLGRSAAKEAKNLGLISIDDTSKIKINIRLFSKPVRIYSKDEISDQDALLIKIGDGYEVILPNENKEKLTELLSKYFVFKAAYSIIEEN